MLSRGVQDSPLREPPFVSVRSSIWQPAKSEVMHRLEVDDGISDGGVHARVYPYVKRALDIAASFGLVILLSPLFAVVALRVWVKKGTTVLQRTPSMGRGCHQFNEYSFNSNVRVLRSLPVLFNILKGDLSFIGPRAACPEATCANCARESLALKRKSVRPGLVCDWWIRRRLSLDYIQEIPLDIRYAQAPTFRKDIGIVLRALPGVVTWLIWGDDPADYPLTVSILGVLIDNVPMQTAIDRVVRMLDNPAANHVCFINPHSINQTFVVPEYKKVLAEADLVLADGFGTKIAGKILHRPLRQNLCGTDLFPRLCVRLSEKGKSIYLLGAPPGAAERVAVWVKQHYPGVIIKGWDHGYFTPEEEPDVVRKIAQSGADLLVVGMGVPKQEIWIHRNLKDLNVKVAMGFGGLFDYFSGRIPRAPQWVREVGMEWVYRLIQEPRRMWRRYLIGNVVFLVRVFQERLRSAPDAGFRP